MENHKKILLVEDMDAVRNIVGATLSMKGYIIDKADNGKQAMDKLGNSPDKYHLIISDYDMPEMNGMEFLEKVRRQSSTRDMPFIMLTSRTEPDKIRQAKSLGLSSWITKPYKIDSFISQVEYAIK